MFGSKVENNFSQPFVGISEQIAIHAQFRPKELALVEEERSVNWQEYDAVGQRIGRALVNQGIQRGERIALLVDNSVWSHELLLGIWRAGAVAVPLSPMLTVDALASMLSDCGARGVFASAENTALAEQAVGTSGLMLISEGSSFADLISDKSHCDTSIDLVAEDLAVIIYSSGTTGTPKGIAHSHGARLCFASVLATQFRYHSHGPVLSSIAIHSNGAWVGWLPAKLVGAPTIVLKRFTPAGFVDVVKKHRPTHGFVVPTMCAGLMEHPDIEVAGLECFEGVITAGAPMSAAMKDGMTRLTDNGLYELWGLTEGVCTIIDPEEMSTRPTSVGRPMLGCEIRLIDKHDEDVTFTGTGEIVGYSSGMMSGYWCRPEANRALLWKDNKGKRFIRTGDIGEFDAEGFLSLRGRIKDMMISGGVNVYPVDIESVLLECDGVRDVSVIGIEHPKWGETPVAFVIVKEGIDVEADELKAWANKRLSRHQHLHDLVVHHGDFPRNTLGKVMKNELSAIYVSGEQSGSESDRVSR